MDLFAVLRELPSVSRVSHLYDEVGERTIDFVFFLCPKMAKGFKLSRHRTGLTTRYTPGNSKSTEDRLPRVTTFVKEAEGLGICFTVSALFSAADALILFPVPLSPPPEPEVNGFRLISNYGIVRERMDQFVDLYTRRPWCGRVPDRVIGAETDRLISFCPDKTPSNVAQDFVERVLAGFALDGVLLREGAFVENPVLLGVETPEVTILQNSMLPREKWLPVVQLV